MNAQVCKDNLGKVYLVTANEWTSCNILEGFSFHQHHLEDLIFQFVCIYNIEWMMKMYNSKL